MNSPALTLQDIAGHANLLSAFVSSGAKTGVSRKEGKGNVCKGPHNVHDGTGYDIEAYEHDSVMLVYIAQ